MDDTDKKIAAIVVILSLAIVSYGGYRVIRGELSKGVQEELYVQRGDLVTVEYTGLLYDSRIYGTEPRVFDTSLENVARNNNTHPKTLTYNWHPGDDPFEFEVGAGSVIPGWEMNIIGMKPGESATWTISPDQAYQPRLEELVKTYNKTETKPVYESLTRIRFSEEYPGNLALIGNRLTHAYWGWPATIFSVNETHVTIENLPMPRETHTTKYGWETYITEIDSSANGGKGIITMEHRPSIGDMVYTEELGRHDPEMTRIQRLQNQQRTTDGIIVGIGHTSFQVDYNSEVYGATLTFRVTLLDIQR